MLTSEQARRRSGGITVFFGAVLATACLYWASPVAIPIACALLLAFLLAPLVAALERRHVRPALAVILVVALAFTLLGAVAEVIGIEVSMVAEELPRYRGNILKKIGDLRGIQKDSALGRLQLLAQDMVKQIERHDGSPADRDKPVPVVVRPPSALWRLPSLLPVAGMAGLVLVLLVFMLLRREDLRNRLVRLFGYDRLAVTTKALDEAGERISRYLARQAIINSSFGLGVGIGLFVIGVPYAMLCGALAAALRFIPYAGPVLAGVLPTLLALAVFPGWTAPWLVVAVVASLELVIYVAIEPWFYAGGTGVSELGLLVGLAFWSWLWGPIGLLLGTPMTVCLVVLGKHLPALAPITMLLSDAPSMPAELVFYQRLIARDQHEADQVARQYLAAHSREALFDDLLLPAVARMSRDHAAGVLTHEDRRFVLDTVEAIARAVGAVEASDATRRPVSASPASQGRGDWPGHDRGTALGFPVRDDADELALRLLSMLLDPAQHQMSVMSSRLLASEVVTAVGREGPAAVCFGTLSPGGFAQIRYLVKRLRAKFPEIAIVVGNWDMSREPPPDWRDRLLSIGANHVGSTLEDVRAHLVHLVHAGSAEPRHARSLLGVGNGET